MLAALSLGVGTLTACVKAVGEDPDVDWEVSKGPQEVRDSKPRDRFRLGKPLSQPTRPATPERPNLLMITVDDAASADIEYMPRVQKLLTDKGLTLEQGLAPTPICVPARASLLTGQYTQNHGARTIAGENGGHQAFEEAGDDDTLPVWLQQEGYDTLFVGKYLNGYTSEEASDVPPGWSEWRATVDASTYNYLHPMISDNGVVEQHHQYSTDLLRDLSVGLLSEPERRATPWYMWVNYVAPHHGLPRDADDPELATTRPADEDQNTFDDLALPDKPNMFEKNVSDKGIAPKVRTNDWSGRKDQLTEARQQRIESLQAVDRAVAKTVSTLKKTCHEYYTYLVFTSDNGWANGEHNLNGKLWYFDEMVTVPMIIRGPGISRGAVSQTPVTNADWAPTFAKLAGATPTRKVDGVDVFPWLDSKATKRLVPIQAYPVFGGSRPRYTGVRFGDWTFVRDREGPRELYYRTVDKWENHSLGRDPRYREQRQRLAQIDKRIRNCEGTSCPSSFYR